MLFFNKKQIKKVLSKYILYLTPYKLNRNDLISKFIRNMKNNGLHEHNLVYKKAVVKNLN